MTLEYLGALLAFLFYNKYPANVFPGDVGTLIIGACIAIIAFIGRVKIIAFIVLIPILLMAFLNLEVLVLWNVKILSQQRLKENGELVAPSGGFNSLIRYILKRPMKEKQVVYIIWSIGIFFGLLGIIIAYVSKGAIIIFLFFSNKIILVLFLGIILD